MNHDFNNTSIRSRAEEETIAWKLTVSAAICAGLISHMMQNRLFLCSFSNAYHMLLLDMHRSLFKFSFLYKC